MRSLATFARPADRHSSYREWPGPGSPASYLHRYTSKGIWVLGTKMQGATRNSTLSLYSTVSGTSCDARRGPAYISLRYKTWSLPTLSPSPQASSCSAQRAPRALTQR